MRAQVGQWFQLGGTMGFGVQADCAAGAFRLVDTQVGSGMPLVGSVPRAVRMLERRGVVGVDIPDQTPEDTMQSIVGADRTLGFKLRGVSLEARACMDALTTSAFGYALVNPRAVLAYDRQNQAMMVMDPDTQVLIVAMGAP